MNTTVRAASSLTILISYIKKNWLPIFSAFVLGLGFPLWRMFVYESSNVSVEVTEIEKEADLVSIDISRDPIFKILASERRSIFGLTTPEADHKKTHEQIQMLIEKGFEEHASNQEKLSNLRETYNQIMSKDLTLQFANQLNEPLIPEIDFEDSIFQDPDESKKNEVKTLFLSEYQSQISELETGLKNQRINLDAANQALKRLQSDSEVKLARLSIECAITNSGAGAISLRPQAFLRVYLGRNTYVDAEMKMEDYDQKGNLPPRSSRIVRYRSEQLEKLNDADQERIITYFKQNVPAVLFVVDINNDMYRSNTVPFAKGLYQQTVFDQLRAEASKRKTPDIN